ncbi:hypothetical protein D3C85_1365530 [compost metagenome]
MLVEQPHQRGVGHGVEGGAGLRGSLGFEHGVELLVGARQPLLAGSGTLRRPGAGLVVGVSPPIRDAIPGFLAAFCYRAAQLGSSGLDIIPPCLGLDRGENQGGGQRQIPDLHVYCSSNITHEHELIIEARRLQLKAERRFVQRQSKKRLFSGSVEGDLSRSPTARQRSQQGLLLPCRHNIQYHLYGCIVFG